MDEKLLPWVAELLVLQAASGIPINFDSEEFRMGLAGEVIGSQQDGCYDKSFYTRLCHENAIYDEDENPDFRASSSVIGHLFSWNKGQLVLLELECDHHDWDVMDEGKCKCGWCESFQDRRKEDEEEEDPISTEDDDDEDEKDEELRDKKKRRKMDG